MAPYSKCSIHFQTDLDDIDVGWHQAQLDQIQSEQILLTARKAGALEGRVQYFEDRTLSDNWTTKSTRATAGNVETKDYLSSECPK